MGGANRIRYFNFSIDSMAPRDLRKTAQAILDSGLQVNWDAELRLDGGLTTDLIRLLREAGCRHLRFGLESASKRILDLMDKRIDLQQVERILRDCRNSDIKASTMVIIGFPGETKEEARQTFDFIYKHNDWIRYFTFHSFWVSRGSIIHNRPDHFGIQLKVLEDSFIQPQWQEKREHGLSQKQQQDLVKEFNNRLESRYPLASEGFSVGIGGTFTFLTANRWSWEDLKVFDGQVQTEKLRDTTQAKTQTTPFFRDKTAWFSSTCLFGNGVEGRSANPVAYVHSPPAKVLRLGTDAVRALNLIDGRRTVAQIAAALNNGESDTEVLKQMLSFFNKLQKFDAIFFRSLSN